MAEPIAKRPHRVRTIEQRIAEIDDTIAAAKAKLEAQVRALEERRQKLAESPAKKKLDAEERKRFDRSVAAIVPEWTVRHMLAAIARAKDENMETLLAEGSALMEAHGKGRGGRRRQRAG
ncbi:hypothetical protein [Acidithiobacillus ferrooxidans]|uniref:hypothetical protein n=1 Tax=Acidithiobacillus ferrooxidans TaxID=920 RepID=UPI000A83942B|nr:hypothetical protein [Acidithiobacillus ferrooxidans]